LCLEPHDLGIAKYVAGRDKDHDFLRAAVRHRLLDRGVLFERLAATPVDDATRDRIRRAIDGDFAGNG
jgi:hypothetical protein